MSELVSVWDGDLSIPEWERENNDWRGGQQHANQAEQEGDEESWRGDVHPDDWPEELAGPEYWLNKKRRNDGE